MSETKDSLDLTPLDADYEILGEFGGQTESRTFTARRKDAAGKRRDDANGVLITVVQAPAGDEGNALTHLAADTKMLARQTHRRLIPIIEGRWLGDAFAIVTQRTNDESLAQKLAKREAFSNPRIAAILREVNGLLEWARDQNVVHREVGANRIYLEPKTDRVRVSFSISSIPRVKNVDAPTADARTIVRLAMAMLLGQDEPALYETQCLADLRSDLPVRLCEASTALLDVKQSHTPEEVHAFIALIGMADPLLVGEAEANRLRADVHEEARVLRETIANERAEFEHTMAGELAAFARLMAEQRDAVDLQMAELRENAAKEEAERLRFAAAERERLADEKAELQRAVLAERAALVTKASNLERAMAERLAEVERAATEDRQRIEQLRAEMLYAAEAELEARRQRELDEMPSEPSALEETAFATLPFAQPVIVPLEQLVFDDDSALMRDDDAAGDVEEMDDTGAGGNDEVVPQTTETQAPGAEPAKAKRKWFIPGAFVVIAAAVGVSALAMRTRDIRQPALAPPVSVAARTPATASVQQVSGSIVPLPAVIVDSSAGMLASGFDANGDAIPKPVRKPRPVVRDSTPVSDGLGDLDALPVPGFLPRPRRDSTTKRDSVVKTATGIPPADPR